MGHVSEKANEKSNLFEFLTSICSFNSQYDVIASKHESRSKPELVRNDHCNLKWFACSWLYLVDLFKLIDFSASFYLLSVRFCALFNALGDSSDYDTHVS